MFFLRFISIIKYNYVLFAKLQNQMEEKKNREQLTKLEPIFVGKTTCTDMK